MRAPQARDDAHRLLPVLLCMPGLRYAAAPQAGRLLRVLLLRIGQVPFETVKPVSAPVVDDEAVGTVVAGLVRALHGDAVEKRAEAPLRHPEVRGMPGRVDSSHELRAAAFCRQRLAGREEPVEQDWRIATGTHRAELDVGHAASGFAPLAEVTRGKSSIGKEDCLAKPLLAEGEDLPLKIQAREDLLRQLGARSE